MLAQPSKRILAWGRDNVEAACCPPKVDARTQRRFLTPRVRQPAPGIQMQAHELIGQRMKTGVPSLERVPLNRFQNHAGSM